MKNRAAFFTLKMPSEGFTLFTLRMPHEVRMFPEVFSLLILRMSHEGFTLRCISEGKSA